MKVEKGLDALLFDIGRMTESALAQGNRSSADASAALAVTLVQVRGKELGPAELSWVASWGEQFFRWQLFARGGEFFGAVATAAQALHGNGGPYMTLVATGVAFACLGGRGDNDPKFAQDGLSLAAEILGGDHPLVRAAIDRHVARGGAPIRPGGGASAAPALQAAPAAGPVTITDEEKALWITMAFFSVGGADGKVGEDEYLAWKNGMAERKLPDVFGKYGAAALKQRLDAGELQRLSAHIAPAPREVKLELVKVAFQIAAADGKIDKDEIATLTGICQFIGLSFDEVLQHTLGMPKAPKPPEERKVDLLVARCEGEAQLYMDLRGATVPRKPQLAKMGDKRIVIFETEVDGKSTLYAFEYQHEGKKLGAGGVPGSSTLIGPTQFLSWADVLGKQVAGTPQGLRADQRETAQRALLNAAECLEEIVKLIPAGQPEVPEAAFTTEMAKKKREANRARYTRPRLEAAARTYRSLADKMPFGQPS